MISFLLPSCPRLNHRSPEGENFIWALLTTVSPTWPLNGARWPVKFRSDLWRVGALGRGFEAFRRCYPATSPIVFQKPRGFPSQRFVALKEVSLRRHSISITREGSASGSYLTPDWTLRRQITERKALRKCNHRMGRSRSCQGQAGERESVPQDHLLERPEVYIKHVSSSPPQRR